MFLVFGVIIAVIFGVADIILLSESKKAGTCVKLISRYAVLVNLLSLFTMRDILKTENILRPSLHGPYYTLKYCALTALAGLVVFMFTGFVRKVLSLEKSQPKNKKAANAVRIIAIIIFVLGAVAYNATAWGLIQYGDLTPDQIIINLATPITGGASDIYYSIFDGPVLRAFLESSLFALFVFSPYKLTYNKKEKSVTLFPAVATRIVALLLAIALLAGGLGYGIAEFQLVDLYKAYFSDDPFIEEHFVDPETVSLKFPEQKRNLIFIYLESMENTFLSKELGGYMEENLMPDLAALADEGYVFSNTGNKLGGFYPSSGGNWSIASMINMNAGIPMKVPTDGNSYGSESSFLNGAVTIGDILQKEGYEQTIMFGAEASFGGLDHYFTIHGQYNIYDYAAAIEKGKIPADYHVWWGYEDDKLYEFAKEEITRMYETGKPFHFVMETADTHAPEGYLSQNAQQKFPDQYSNTIYYSQAEAVKFVRWIQEQPFYDNTTVILIGDHLTMAACITNSVHDYARTCFNLIINPPENLKNIPEDRFKNRSWANFDMFPTVLTCLNAQYDGNRMGLGTDLFSDQKTLFEEYGVAETNESLKQKSNFYNQNILIQGK